jgi:probable phosphoglycerate mutase
VLPALDELLAERWDTALAVLHGAVNRAILSWALTGERLFLGAFEQAAGCINVVDVSGAGEEWIVRAVNVAPLDLVHGASRLTQMEHYWEEFRPFRERSM